MILMVNKRDAGHIEAPLTTSGSIGADSSTSQVLLWHTGQGGVWSTYFGGFVKMSYYWNVLLSLKALIFSIIASVQILKGGKVEEQSYFTHLGSHNEWKFHSYVAQCEDYISALYLSHCALNQSVVAPFLPSLFVPQQTNCLFITSYSTEQNFYFLFYLI